MNLSYPLPTCPDFQAVVQHMQGIANKVALVPNLPQVAGMQALQQQIDANHQQIMTVLGQMQGQIGQIQNEY